MIMLIIAVVFLLGPGIIDLMGFKQSNIDVYEQYVQLELKRRYEKRNGL